MNLLLLIFLGTLNYVTGNPNNDLVEVKVDWESFLSRSDLTWTTAPTEWYEAGFVGNGKLGGLISYNDTFEFKIGSTAIWDDRPHGPPYNILPEDFSCTSPRLPSDRQLLDTVRLGVNHVLSHILH